MVKIYLTIYKMQFLKEEKKKNWPIVLLLKIWDTTRYTLKL